MKKITPALPVLLAGMLLSTTVLASHENPYPELTEQCRTLAHDMLNMTHYKDSDPCAGDIEVAAAYVQASCTNIERGKLLNAMNFIGRANDELEDISLNRSYCANMAAEAKHYRSEVVRIHGDLLSLAFLRNKALAASIDTSAIK